MVLPSPRADERWGKPVQITGAQRPGKGPDYMAYVFVFLGSISICRSYKSTLSDQAQLTLQLRVSHFNFGSSILAGPSLLTRGQRKKFLTGTRTCSRQPWDLPNMMQCYLLHPDVQFKRSPSRFFVQQFGFSSHPPCPDRLQSTTRGNVGHEATISFDR